MAVESFTWIKPDAPASNGGDSAEVDGITLTTRRIAEDLGWVADGTHYLCQNGNDGADDWMQIPTDVYTAITGSLTAAEILTAVTSEPASFSESSTVPIFQPKTGKKSLFVIGDSLSAGTSGGGLTSAPALKAINGISGETLVELSTEPADRGWVSDNWALNNLAVNSSSYANTVDQGGGEDAYPFRFDLTKAQRYESLNLNGDATSYILMWLGTNDLAYDATLTGANAWTRASTAIGNLKTAFPNVPLIVCTPIRRSELSALNDRLSDFKDEMVSNYATAGADYLVRCDQAHASFDIDSGDTTDTNVYAGDGVHLVDNGYAQIGATMQTTLESL